MIDLWIVGIFLLITLVVGVWQGRGITNLSIFSIANKKYSTAILVTTITATFLSGGDILGDSEKSFRYGILFILVLIIGNLLKTFIVSDKIAPHIDKFQGCISIGDMMGIMYGKPAKVLTGITGTLMYITGLGAQVNAIGYIFHSFLGVSHITGIMIGCSIVIIYSTFGGMKAVTITDVLQFIVLIIAVPMICNIGVYKVGGYQALFNSLPASHLNILPHNKHDLIKNLEIFFTLLFTLVGPAMAQRLLMAQNSTQAVHSFRYAAVIYVFFFTLMGLIGLSAKVLNPTLDPVNATPYIVKLLPIGLKGIAIAGMLAVVMSTADSLLNAAATLLVNDVLNPACKYKLTEKAKLRAAQLATVLIGILSITAAISSKSAFDITIFSHIFWNPIIIVPFYCGVRSFSADRRSFYAATVGAVLTVLIWRFNNVEALIGIGSTLPGMLANAIFFFGSHYYYKLYKPEQFEPIPSLENPNEPIGGKKKSQLSNSRSVSIRQTLLNICSKIKRFSLVEFSHNKVKEFGASYQLFGAFTVLNYVFFTNTTYPTFLLFLKLISGVLCVGLFFAPELTRKYSKYFSLYWHSTLMFALPFISCSMVILHHGSSYWLLNMSISILALALLVDWISFIGILTLGLIFSCITVKVYTGHLSFNPTGYDILLGLYMVASSIIFGTFFSRKREDYIEEKLETLRAMGGTIAHYLLFNHNRKAVYY